LPKINAVKSPKLPIFIHANLSTLGNSVLRKELLLWQIGGVILVLQWTDLLME